MCSTIREIVWDDKVCHHFDLGLVQEVIRPEQVQLVLHGCHAWEERERVLNMYTMLYWLIALALSPQLSQRAVYSKVVCGLRLVQPDLAQQVPVKSAFSSRREQLGVAPLEWLFALCAGPQASPQTPAAFWGGMRLMAIDGQLSSVPDTQSNRAFFRSSSADEVSRSPFPLVRLVLLIECGTHLICDAQFSSCRQADSSSAREVLARSLEASMRLVWDSGFHCSALIFLAHAGVAHVLGRVICNVLTKPVKHLEDGSYLTSIYEDQDHHGGQRMLVRVISSTFPDERVPGAGQTTHRVVTTRLSPEQYPAKELAVLFHERWHVEVVVDEIKTHLRLSARTLRSLSPEGVLQELYGLLLAHVAVRTLMRHSATDADVAPTQLSFTATVRLLDESLPALTLASWAHRLTLSGHLLVEIAAERLPAQRLRFQARVVKRVRSK